MVKQRLLEAVTRARSQGLSVQRVCQLLQLRPARYYAWCAGQDPTTRTREELADRKPGPMVAPHRLLPAEQAAIAVLAQDPAYAHCSPRQLAVVASEHELVQASASTFYRQLRAARLNRTRMRRPRPRLEKPEVKATKPNEAWAWDLTYLSLGSCFVYLVAILDLYSRKIVGWHLSLDATVSSVKRAWDRALAWEGLLTSGEAPAMPVALSDHGVQMTAKSIKQFFKELGIRQRFARYHTPTDNAFIESWFKLVKWEWLEYHDYFTFYDLEQLLAEFVRFYNQSRYHGGISYVTPDQRHTGQDQAILARRAERRRQARLQRLTLNRGQTNIESHSQAA